MFAVLSQYPNLTLSRMCSARMSVAHTEHHLSSACRMCPHLWPQVIKRTVDRSAPDFANYLGWCTWDSFYTQVDDKKVFTGLESLEKAGMLPSTC